MAEIQMEVKEDFGVINEKKNIRLRLVSWSEREPKYDIRPWYVPEDGEERPSKGITLTKEELLKLAELIKEI